jgi:hypothetical protein
LFIACAVFLTQCDAWGKPVIEQILKDAEEFNLVKEIIVTKYPFPNTFSINSGIPDVLKNGDAEDWDKQGLEVSAIMNEGEIQKLPPASYTVEKIKAFPSSEGKMPVTVTYNGDPGITTSFQIMVVSLNENYHEVKIDPGISSGSLVPFPSVMKEGETATVYVYPDDGYAYTENSISNIPPPPPI